MATQPLPNLPSATRAPLLPALEAQRAATARLLQIKEEGRRLLAYLTPDEEMEDLRAQVAGLAAMVQALHAPPASSKRRRLCENKRRLDGWITGMSQGSPRPSRPSTSTICVSASQMDSAGTP